MRMSRPGGDGDELPFYWLDSDVDKPRTVEEFGNDV
jgi:hypothetical protein